MGLSAPCDVCHWLEKSVFSRMNRKYLASSIGLLLACAVGAMAAQAAGPAADYKIDPKRTSTSPDGATTIEQYARISADGDYAWQFWARHQDKLTLLKPEQPDYAAGFRFTSDSQWLVRMQKTGAGYASLYLYHLGPQGFVAATAKPLSDLAWAYFKRRPESRKIRKPDFHIEAGLVKGPTTTIARWVRTGPTAVISSSPCRVRCHPTAAMVSFGRFAAGAAGMICKRARSTCRRILPRTMRRQLLPSGKKGVLDDSASG
jgi:hypothetical protein